jgi:hypothetical protein
MPVLELSPAAKDRFRSLACRLSPENLSCDGEISRTEVGRRLREIHSEWKALESKVGRPVSEDEVWKWYAT